MLFCFGAGGPRNGPYRRIVTCWQPHHGLHQPGCCCEVLPAREGRRCFGEDWTRQRPPTRFASPRGGLLRHCVGVVHALLLSRGAALLAGGSAMVVGSVGRCEGGWQEWHFASPQPLGSEPLQKLYEAIVAPIAEKRTKGAWYREGRLISLDGSTLDTADTLENEKAFGRPGASRGSSAFPKIRFVALLENGTHVLWAARMSKYRTDEITLAQDVVPALRKGMLCLADRFFPGYKLWRKAARTGAELLWRTRQNARLDVDRRLPDGSYLSRIYASTSDRRNQRKGIVVRAIDYRLKDVPDAEPVYRLITTILDPTQAPAQELAALYHERWEIETALDELKTRCPDRAAQQDAGVGETGVLGTAHGPLRHSRS